MPYTAEISRSNPTCFLFMVDQSRSMSDEIAAGDATQQKATGVADTVNRWMQELSLKCAKSEGIGDYYHVGVIGYGKNVGPAFVGNIAGRDLVPISEIAENPGRIEERQKKVPDGKGGLTEQNLKVPIWFDPTADGATPMCRASAEAHRVLTEWLSEHPDCFPPVVIHITDGEATDGDPEQRIRALTHLSSSDGDTMLFNIHLSANPNAKPVIFPDSPDQLPDDYSKMLFNTASALSPTMRSIAKEQGIPTSEASRAFVLNADMVLLVQAVDIGTRASNADAASSTAAATAGSISSSVMEPIAGQDSEDGHAAPTASVSDAPAGGGSISQSTMQPIEGQDSEDAGNGGTSISNSTMEPVAGQESETSSAAPAGANAAPAGASAAPAGASAAPAGAAATKPAAGKKKVRLTGADGKLIEATIDTDEDGNIVNVVPVKPLDPDQDYGVGPGAP